MLGVIIDNVNYVGFKVINDDDSHAPDYRLFALIDDKLQKRGDVWKLVTGVLKRKKKPHHDRPVTTLFIRILKTGWDGIDGWDHYVGIMKEDSVYQHHSGSGIMGDRVPSFGVYRRELKADDADVPDSAVTAPFSGIDTSSSTVRVGTASIGSENASIPGIASSASIPRVDDAIPGSVNTKPVASDAAELLDSDDSTDLVARVFGKSAKAAGLK